MPTTTLPSGRTLTDLNLLTAEQASRLLNKAETELLRDLVLYDFKFYFEQIAFPGFKLSQTHLDTFNAWDGAETNFLLGFPGSSKSSCLHTARHAWMANRNRWEVQNGLADRPMVFLSGSYNSKAAVTLFTRNIKRQLGLPVMAFLFGAIIDPNCSDAGFNLLGLDYSHEKDNAVQACGVAEGDVAGYHGDIFTCDDIVTFRLARSPVERMALAEKFHIDIWRVLRRPPHKFAGTQRPPQLNVIGYPHHSSDIYADLQDKNIHPKFSGRLTSWPVLNEKDESAFPELYSTTVVHGWREGTPRLTWEGAYMIRSKGMTGDIIDDKWLLWWADNPPPEKLWIYVGGDLSIGETEGAARCAYFALGYEPETERRWEIDCIYGHWSFAERIDKLIEFCRPYQTHTNHWRLKKVGIEKPASGSDVVATLQYRTALPIEAITPLGDKNSRLVEKSHLFQYGKMILKGPARNDIIPRIGDWPHELTERRTTVKPANGTVDRTDAYLIAEHLISPNTGKVGLQAFGPRRQTQEALARF